MANQARDAIGGGWIFGDEELGFLIDEIISPNSYKNGTSSIMTVKALSMMKAQSTYSLGADIYRHVVKTAEELDYIMGMSMMYLAISPDAYAASNYMIEYQQSFVPNSAGNVTGDIVGTNYSEVKPTQDWIDMNQVSDYVTRLRAGETLSTIEAINVPGKGIYILDGHHRYVASMITGIPVEMRITTQPGPIGLPDWSYVEPLK